MRYGKYDTFVPSNIKISLVDKQANKSNRYNQDNQKLNFDSITYTKLKKINYMALIGQQKTFCEII